MRKLKVLTTIGIVLLGSLVPLMQVSAADISTVNPGYFVLDMQAGESRDIKVNYYNAEERDLRLSYTLSNLVAQKDGSGFTLTPAPEFSNWVTWVSPEPKVVSANTAVDITFRLTVPANAVDQSYVPVISILPELPVGDSSNAASNNYAISTVVYINKGDGAILGTATGGKTDIIEFAPKYSFVFTLENKFKLNILNNTNYYHELRGKILVTRPNGIVSETFIPLNTETPLLKSQSWLQELPWSEDLTLIDKLKATGMYTAEVRLRIDDSYLYAQAKLQFLYIPFELIIIVVSVFAIVLMSVLYYRKRHLKLRQFNV